MTNRIFRALFPLAMLAAAGCRMSADLPSSVIVAYGASSRAAQELKTNLDVVYGTDLPIVSNAVSGVWNWTLTCDPESGLGPEEGRWTVVSGGVRFTGATPEGVYHAVCGFLEDEVGVRWPWGGEIAAPADPPRSFAPGSGAWIPAVPRRKIRSRNAAYESWCERLGYCDGPGPTLGHSFTDYWQRYSKTDPEIFAMREDGRRLPADAPADVADAAAYAGDMGKAISMCVSSPRLVELVVENWRKAGRPEYVNVCENDSTGKNACHCADCQALDVRPDPPPGEMPCGRDCMADRYVAFARRVLEVARKERSDAKVSFYAYNATERAPRRERLAEGLVPGLVPTRFDYASLTNYISSWKRAGLGSFVYRPNRHLYFYSPYLPLGSERHFYRILQYAVASGAVGFDYDMAYDQQHDEVLDWFSDYLLMKGMKDPTRDFAYWERHYMYAFGAAGDDVAAYFRYWRENIWEKKLEPDVRRLTDQGRWWFFNRGLFGRTGVKGHLAEYYSESDFDATDAILAHALSRPGLSSAQRARVARLVDANRHARLFFRAVTDKCEKNARALRDFRMAHGIALKPWYEIYYGDLCGIQKLEGSSLPESGRNDVPVEK